MSKSMYNTGKRIKTISEFDQCESLWYKWNGKTTHRAVLISKASHNHSIFENESNGMCGLNVDARVSFYPWSFCSKAERRTE